MMEKLANILKINVLSFQNRGKPAYAKATAGKAGAKVSCDPAIYKQECQQFFLFPFPQAVSLPEHEYCVSVSPAYPAGDYGCFTADGGVHHAGRPTTAVVLVGGAGQMDCSGLCVVGDGLAGVSPHAPDVCLFGLQRSDLPFF